MASLGMNFVANDIPEDEGSRFELIPSGTRALIEIIEADVIPTKSGEGLKYKAKVVTGPYEKKWVKGFLNIQNNDEDTELRGLQELARLCKAIGLPGCEDSDDLIGKVFDATIGIKKSTNPQFSDENKVNVYHAKAAPGAPTPTLSHRATAAARSDLTYASTATVAGASPKKAWPRRAAPTAAGQAVNAPLSQELDDEIPF